VSIVFLALIAGSLFYLSRILLDYRNYEMRVMPEVEQLEKKIAHLDGQMVIERQKLENVKETVASLRGVREDLMRDVEEAKGQLVAEKGQYQTLVLELQKRQFRGTLARGRKLVLR